MESRYGEEDGTWEQTSKMSRACWNESAKSKHRESLDVQVVESVVVLTTQLCCCGRCRSVLAFGYQHFVNSVDLETPL